MTGPRIAGLIETYRRAPVEFVGGSGATLVDAGGKRYVDLLAGIAVAGVGHCHPVVVDAIRSQSERLLHASNLFYTRPGMELAARLNELSGMDSFFCNSGAEAVECALKIVRKWWSIDHQCAPRVIAAQKGFHGRTFGALSATGQPDKQEAFQPLVPGFTHVPFGDVDAIEAAMGPDVAAVLLEPIQGEAGVIIPPDGYLKAVRELCDRWGCLLVLDEIQTGLGRTGTWFAYEHDGIRPDVVTLAKSLGAGLPIGACMAFGAAAEAFSYGDHGSTFGAGPVPAAAAVAVLDVIEKEGLIERAADSGPLLMGLLEESFRGDAAIRGKGLMIAATFDEPVATSLAEAALRNGVIVNAVTADTLRFLPPLVITEDEINEATTILGEVWRTMSSAGK